MAPNSNLFGFAGPRLAFDITDKFASAVRNGVRGANNGVVAAAVALSNTFGNDADLDRIHKTVAQQARVAVRLSYGQTVTARSPRPPQSYRVGDNRYSGGILFRALQQPSMAVGDSKGISFVDRDMLNREAKHWMRLNFGAKGSGVSDRPGTRFRFVFDSAVVFSLQFRTQARPAFFLPVGMFYGPGGERIGRQAARRGMDAFRPTGRKVAIMPTRGIEARNFLDAGLAVIATELPAAYKVQFEAWFRQGTQAGKAYANQLQVVRPGNYTPKVRVPFRV